MSEYQYYEFQAIDNPLSDKDIKALRKVSSRAQITSTSFVNEYHFGDFKGSPKEFMKRWFDLHLYLANWGTRRLMIRLPKRLVDRSQIAPFQRGFGILDVVDAGDNLILDFHDSPEDSEYYDGWVEGSGWLSGMASLRSDILSGDLRALYVAWLWTVDQGDLRNEIKEPLPGIGPLNAGLKTLADFLRIDPDLVTAAAEESAVNLDDKSLQSTTQAAIKDIPNAEKAKLLCRLAEGDPHVALELRKRVSEFASVKSTSTSRRLRTAADLRDRTKKVRAERKLAELNQRAVEREQQRIEKEKARRKRLDSVLSKGEFAWQEVEDEIAIRSGRSYDTAAQLLFDLKTLADEHGTTEDFFKRLDGIRRKHANKPRFIERLENLQRN